MGNWINKDGWCIAVTHMDDQYLIDIIAGMASGSGPAAEVVLRFIDEAYAEAKRRRLLGVFSGWLLKAYTVRLWKKRKVVGRYPFADKILYKRTPWWVCYIISTRIPRRGRRGKLKCGENHRR